MFLRVVKSAASLLIKFPKKIDVSKALLNIIAINVESLTKKDIKCILKKMIKDDKTACWIVTDYVR